MKRRSVALVLFSAIAVLAGRPEGRPQSGAPPTTTSTRAHVEALASAPFDGRLAGSAGERLASDYLVSELRKLGARPLPGKSDYLMAFDFTAGTGDGGSWLAVAGLRADAPATAASGTSRRFGGRADVRAKTAFRFADLGLRVPRVSVVLSVEDALVEPFVWRILRRAKSQGKSLSVVVTESRPANEGLWTVTEMEKDGIPVSVSIDACIGELIPQCDVVFVGADAISSHGAALCKVGTYPSALVAHAHGVPFFIAADTLKFDSSTLIGLPFRVDPIHWHEVLGDQQYSDLVKVSGYLFDETPANLVTAIITELGLLNPAACFSVMWQMKLSQQLSAMLPAWVKNEL